MSGTRQHGVSGWHAVGLTSGNAGALLSGIQVGAAVRGGHWWVVAKPGERPPMQQAMGEGGRGLVDWQGIQGQTLVGRRGGRGHTAHALPKPKSESATSCLEPAGLTESARS